MLMKQHSYMAYNQELAFKNKVYQEALAKLGEAKKKDEAAELPETIQELKKELVKETTSYPNNITFKNFFYYLLVPTLVYELEYPTTNRYLNLI